jgi:hypothetical protein
MLISRRAAIAQLVLVVPAIVLFVPRPSTKVDVSADSGNFVPSNEPLQHWCLIFSIPSIPSGRGTW